MAGAINSLTGELDDELEKARETLKGYDQNIKKLFGKEVNELAPFGQRGRRTTQDPKEDFYGKDSAIANANGRPRIRRGEEAFSEEPWEKRRRNEGEYVGGGGRMGMNPGIRGRFDQRQDDAGFGGFAEGGDLRGRLQSRIISSAKEKSRDEVLAEQREDRPGLTRNRRMFGALLGTLQRFKQDETKLKDKEEKRAQIEAKLDEAAKNEREGVRKEKQQLIRDRKYKMTEIRRLEVKKTRLEELEQWETKTRYLSNFIRTDAKPHIFYRPKIMNPVMDCRLEQSKQLVSEMIAAKRKECFEELEKFEQKSKRYWEQQKLDSRDGKRPKIDQYDDVDMEEELKFVLGTEEVVEDMPETEEVAEDFTVTVSAIRDNDESDNGGPENDAPDGADHENEEVSRNDDSPMNEFD